MSCARILFACCLTLLLCFGAVSAEDKPAEFYKDNFAETPLDRQHSVSTAGKGAQGASATGTATDVSRPVRTHDAPLIAKGVSSASLEGFDVQPVLEVGLIVNAFDQEHFVQYGDKHLELLLDRNLKGGDVYLKDFISRGEPLEFKYNFFMLSTVLGSRTRVVRSLPEKYAQVKMSPTWIIKTEKGEYLLEGVESPEKFITADGGFVEKPVAAPSLEEAKPTPTPLKPATF